MNILMLIMVIIIIIITIIIIIKIMAIIIKLIIIIVIIMIIVKIADAVYFGNFLLFHEYVSSKKNKVVRFFVSDHGSS